MKRHFISILCLTLWGGVIHAATWVSPESGSYQDAANWDTNAVPGMGTSVSISGNVTVTDNEKRDWWEQNVTVSDGATFNVAASVLKWQRGTITVQNGGRIVIAKNGDMKVNNSDNLVINCLTPDGLHIDEHIEVTNSGANASLLNFGLAGSMYIKEIWAGDWAVSMSFTLDIGTSASSAIYSIETRTLVDLYHNTNPGGGAVNNLFVTSSIGKDLNDQSLTSVANESDLTADASGLGKYFLYRDDAAGGDWVVKYVKATTSVPEPSTALMGVFGLTGLLLRRRR